MSDKMAYGVPVPRGVRKDWECSSMDRVSGGVMLRRKGVADRWGDPIRCVAWFDRFERCRLCVGHYANGIAATVRIDANGKWKTSFSDAPVGTHPEGGDAVAAPFMGDAVPKAGAQT